MSFRVYPSYKEPGVEWLGQVPEHWECRTLQVSASSAPFAFVDGPFGSDLKNEEYIANGIPLIQLNNIGVGSHSLATLNFVSEEKAHQLRKHQALPGDIVIAKMADPVARAARVSNAFDSYVIVADCIKLAIDRSRFEDNYLLHYINSPSCRAMAESQATGTTRLRINLGTLKKLPLLVPPLPEQRAIAAFLDRETARLDTLIAKQERLIELSMEKRRALISHAVTRGLDASAPLKDSGVEWLGQVPQHWELWKIAHAFKHIGSGTTPPSDEPMWYEGDIPWVTTGELREGVVKSTSKCVGEETLRKFTSLRLHPVGSVAIAMYGATIGRLAFLGVEAVTNQACCVIASSEVVEQQYLFYWLLGYRDEIISLSVGGGQPNINQEIISQLRISAPSLNEQRAIVKYLDGETAKIDTLIDKARRSIELMKEHRASLIAAAVTGKIDVRERVGAA